MTKLNVITHQVPTEVEDPRFLMLFIMRIGMRDDSKKMKKHIHIASFLVFAALGAVLSYILLLNHFSILTSICDAGPRINCDIVNQSLYSTVFGIPVALVGILGYSFLFLLAAANIFLKKRYFAQIIFFLSLGGALFSAYLTGTEAFILHTYCLYCLTSQTIIILLSIFSYHTMKNFNPVISYPPTNI